MSLDSLKLLFELQPALGAALPQDYQLFVSQHYRDLAKFILTDAGKKASQKFVEAWDASLREPPKELLGQITTE